MCACVGLIFVQSEQHTNVLRSRRLRSFFNRFDLRPHAVPVASLDLAVS